MGTPTFDSAPSGTSGNRHVYFALLDGYRIIGSTSQPVAPRRAVSPNCRPSALLGRPKRTGRYQKLPATVEAVPSYRPLSDPTGPFDEEFHISNNGGIPVLIAARATWDQVVNGVVESVSIDVVDDQNASEWLGSCPDNGVSAPVARMTSRPDMPKEDRPVFKDLSAITRERMSGNVKFSILPNTHNSP